jgi:hypothetical protein
LRGEEAGRQKTEDRSQKIGVRRPEPGGRMRMPATKFEDLVVWQKAHQFVLAACRLSRTILTPDS